MKQTPLFHGYLILHLLTILVFNLLLSPTLLATTFPVKSVAELESALMAAENNDENDTILIVSGTYYLTSSLVYDTTKAHSITLQGTGSEVVTDGGG